MINYIEKSTSSVGIDVEINNYLFYLNKACSQKNDVRRFVKHIVRLFEKLNSLPIDYLDGSVEEKRTLRNSSRYISKIKKYLKKVKTIDISVFLCASNLLREDNKENRYFRADWDSEKIYRALSGDISSLIKRKRKDLLIFSESITSTGKTDDLCTVYFDEKDVDSKIEKNELDISDQSEDELLDEQFDLGNITEEDDNHLLDDILEKNIFSDVAGSSTVEDDIYDFYFGESDDRPLVEKEDNVKEFEKVNKIDKIEENDSIDNLFVNDNGESDVKNSVSISSSEDIIENKDETDDERVLTKRELVELKKEIDFNEDLFVDLNNISVSQKLVIDSYSSVCKKYESLSKTFPTIYNNISNNEVIKIYEKMYDFVGSLISEMFEHIIHLSKVSCEKDSKGDIFKEKYVMNGDVIQVFGKYDLFIVKVQNMMKILDEKYSDKLSSTEKKILSNSLWNKYRLDDISPSSIKEAVSLDLMSFINENPFTLLQTVVSTRRKNEEYKKYDLNRILDNIDFSLEKFTPELVQSMETKINHDNSLSETEKAEIINNIKRCFSSYIGEIHGIRELPISSYSYLISFIMNNVFHADEELSSKYNECVSDVYSEELSKYKSLGFFGRLLGKSKKPTTDEIKLIINNFCDDVCSVDYSL